MSEQNTKFQNIVSAINIVVGLLAVVTSLLLLSGYSYRIGYFSAFGLGINSIPMEFSESVGEAYYLSLLFLVELGERIWWPMFGVLLLVIAAGVLLFVIILGGEGKFGSAFKNWILTLQDEAPNQPRWRKGLGLIYEDIIVRLGANILLGIIILSSVVLMMSKSFFKGTANGSDQLQLYADVNYECKRLPEKGLPCVQVIQLVDQQLVVEGLSISGGSESHLAVFDGKSVYVLQRSSDTKIVITSNVSS